MCSCHLTVLVRHVAGLSLPWLNSGRDQIQHQENRLFMAQTKTASTTWCTGIYSKPMGQYIDPKRGMLVDNWVCEVCGLSWHITLALEPKAPLGQRRETSTLLVDAALVHAACEDVMWQTDKPVWGLTHNTLQKLGVSSLHVLLLQHRWIETSKRRITCFLVNYSSKCISSNVATEPLCLYFTSSRFGHVEAQSLAQWLITAHWWLIKYSRLNIRSRFCTLGLCWTLSPAIYLFFGHSLAFICH